jgi:2-methylisocitrate lyase-like PEP mutase family enzyme
MDAALERAERYLECGVDALFIEALQTTEELDAACRRFGQRVPLLANMVEGGQTPLQTAGQLQQRGFRIVIFPGGTVRSVAQGMQEYFASLLAHQSTGPWRARMMDFDGLNRVIGTEQLLAEGKRYE